MKQTTQSPSFDDAAYALLLAKEEGLIAEDRRRFFEINIQSLVFMDEGVKAAAKLAEKCALQERLPDVILYRDQLKDMSGEAFAQLLQLHPRLKSIPVVAVTSEVEVSFDNTKLALTKSYSPQDLAQAINAAKKEAEAPSEQSEANAFEKRVEELLNQKQKKVHDTYLLGLKALKGKNYKEGTELLQSALKLDPEHTNSLTALSIAWKEQGEPKKYLETLNALLSIHMEKNQWDQARRINKQLVAVLNNQSNPLYDKAAELLASGRASEAAQAVAAGRTDAEQDQYMYEKLIDGCSKTYSPHETIQKFKEELLNLGDANLAKNIESYVEKSMPKRGKEKDQILPAEPKELEEHVFLLYGKQKRKKKKKPVVAEDPEELLKKKITPPKMLGFAPKIQEIISVFKYTSYLFRLPKNKKRS